MALAITKIMWNTYQAHVMMLATEKTRPGMLVEVDWHFNGNCTIERDEAFVWHVTNRFTESQCSTKDYSSNIINGSITDKVDLSGSAKIPKIGIEATGGFSTSNKVLIEIKEIKMRGFENTFLHFDIQKELRGLKFDDFRKYLMIKNDLLVTEAYYISSLTVEFSEKDEANAQAAYQDGNINIEAGYEASWESAGKLTLKNPDPKVPFAVRGIRI